MYRKITDWEWYTDTNTFRVFFHLLVSATHRDIKFKGIELKRGQVITGRSSLAKELGLSEMQIRTVINRLKSTGEITVRSTSRYSIITVENYSSYQYGSADEQPAEQPATRLHDNQVVTTYKNIKNKKNNTLLCDQAAEIYQQYPKHVGGKAAIESIVKALGKVGYEELLGKVKAYAESCAGKDKKFIPLPTTWFNQERWLDEIVSVVSSAPSWSHLPDEEWYAFYDRYRVAINCESLNGVPITRADQEDNLRRAWHRVGA